MKFSLPFSGTSAVTPPPQLRAAGVSAPKQMTAMRSTGGLSRFLASLNTMGMSKDRNEFVSNMGILLNSGLTVLDALRALQMEIRRKPMRKIVARIIDDVENGIALWQAMDNCQFFSPYALALIRVGEEAGSLSQNMEYLSVQQEKDNALKQKVKMAMIYPSIVLALTITITIGLAWFVLPQLVGVLLSLNAKLPLATRVIIIIADFFKEHGSVAVPLFVVFTILFIIICRYTPLRGPVQEIIFYIPGIGALARSATIARFGVILGSLIKAGIPVVDSIRSLANVTDILSYQAFFFKLADEIEVGQSFSKAFSSLKDSRKLIPISVQQLITTGEKSGKISAMLLRIADIYEKKAQDTAEKLPLILEPMLLLFMGGLVGTIAFAIIVPIYSIVGSVGH